MERGVLMTAAGAAVSGVGFCATPGSVLASSAPVLAAGRAAPVVASVAAAVSMTGAAPEAAPVAAAVEAQAAPVEAPAALAPAPAVAPLVPEPSTPAASRIAVANKLELLRAVLAGHLPDDVLIVDIDLLAHLCETRGCTFPGVIWA